MNPPGRTKTRLGDVLSLSRDQVRVEAGSAYPNLGIYSFGRGVFEKADIDGSSTSATTLFRVHEGQFIYSRLFAFEGAYAFVPTRFDGYFVSNEFPSFDVDTGRVDVRWLSWYLRSRDRWTELGGSSKGIGVRRQRVPVDAVLNYQLPLPPLPYQRKVVAAIAKLEAVSIEREKADRLMAALMTAAVNARFKA